MVLEGAVQFKTHSLFFRIGLLCAGEPVLVLSIGALIAQPVQRTDCGRKSLHKAVPILFISRPDQLTFNIAVETFNKRLERKDTSGKQPQPRTTCHLCSGLRQVVLRRLVVGQPHPHGEMRKPGLPQRRVGIYAQRRLVTRHIAAILSRLSPSLVLQVSAYSLPEGGLTH